MKLYLKAIGLLLLSFINAYSMNSNNCISKDYYGEIEICLPEISGMIESKNMSFLLVDSLISLTSTQKVITFAVYLDSSLYKKYKSGIFDQGLNNYFSITAIEPMKDQKSDINTLKEISNLVSSGFLRDEWNEIQNNLEKYFTNLNIGVPVLIDDYSLNSNTLTLITMVKYQNNSETWVNLIAMNLILVKDRIFFIQYHIPYTGIEAMEKIKGLNDYAVLRFIDVN